MCASGRGGDPYCCSCFPLGIPIRDNAHGYLQSVPGLRLRWSLRCVIDALCLCEDGCAQNHQEKCKAASHFSKGRHLGNLTSKFVDLLEPKEQNGRGSPLLRPTAFPSDCHLFKIGHTGHMAHLPGPVVSSRLQFTTSGNTP